MVNLGTVNEDSTVRFQFGTAAATGAEENFSATLEQADVVVRKDGADMTLDASTITITNLATGLYEVAIDTSNDADFTTGSTYWVRVDPDTETVDAVAVSAPIGLFTIESAPEKAVRILREKLYPTDSTISTVASNSTTAINLTDVVDAQTPDSALIGLILAVHDATDDRVEHVVVTAASSLVATVQRLGDGTAMSFTVAAGDHVWIVGYSDLAHVPDANIASISDDSTAADNLEAAYDGTGYDLGGIDVSELNGIVDDLIDGGRLDLILDAILLDTGTTIQDLINGLNDPTSAAIVSALMAEVIENSVTFKESIALQNAAAAGKASGMGTTSATLRNLADTLDRVAATVDSDGNRSAVTTTFTDL